MEDPNAESMEQQASEPEQTASQLVISEPAAADSGGRDNPGFDYVDIDIQREQPKPDEEPELLSRQPQKLQEPEKVEAEPEKREEIELVERKQAAPPPPYNGEAEKEREPKSPGLMMMAPKTQVEPPKPKEEPEDSGKSSRRNRKKKTEESSKSGSQSPEDAATSSGYLAQAKKKFQMFDEPEEDKTGKQTVIHLGDTAEKREPREQYDNLFQYLLACIGFAVGLGSQLKLNNFLQFW